MSGAHLSSFSSPAPALSTFRAPFNGSPSEEAKEVCLNAFLATQPSKENREQFRVFLDSATTVDDMHTAALIVRTAQMFYSNLEELIRLFGPEEAKRIAEEGIVEGEDLLWEEDLSDEDFQRLYRELFPFGSTPQDVLFAKLYKVNNLDGCQKRNQEKPSSRRHS